MWPKFRRRRGGKRICHKPMQNITQKNPLNISYLLVVRTERILTCERCYLILNMRNPYFLTLLRTKNSKSKRPISTGQKITNRLATGVIEAVESESLANRSSRSIQKLKKLKNRRTKNVAHLAHRVWNTTLNTKGQHRQANPTKTA